MLLTLMTRSSDRSGNPEKEVERGELYWNLASLNSPNMHLIPGNASRLTRLIMLRSGQ